LTKDKEEKAMEISRIKWFAMLSVLYLGMMGAGTCGQKALEQIDAAKDVIEDAREVNAPEYAPDEFRSAEESLLLAREQYDGYLFRRAEDSALIAESQGRQALEIALSQKSRVDEDERRRREEEEAARLAYNVSSLFADTVAEPSLEEEAKMALHDIHFGFDSFEISEAAKNVLALDAEWLSEHSSIKVEVEGHTDDRGTDEYNLALGAKRAKTAYDHLIKLGVDPSRVRTISYGESVPLDPGASEEAWAKNRRVHFAVIH